MALGSNQLNSKSFYEAFNCLACQIRFDIYKTKLSEPYLDKKMGAVVDTKNLNQTQIFLINLKKNYGFSCTALKKFSLTSENHFNFFSLPPKKVLKANTTCF